MAGAGATGAHARVPSIQRLSTNDLAILASDCGRAPFNIAALLVIDRGSEVPFTQVRDALAARLPQVPRLRQLLRVLPIGLGRPLWVDDETFDITLHTREVALHGGAATRESPASGSAAGQPPDRDEKQLLLDRVGELVCEPLPRNRALWRAHWISGLQDGRAALLIVVHHVVADGLGGLAALAALADQPGKDRGESQGQGGRSEGRPDEVGAEPVRPFPAPVPSRADLVKEAWRARAHALRRTRSMISATRSGLRELDVTEHAPRLITLTSMNQPTGPRRAVSVSTVPLRAVVDTAHATGSTVNDVVLTAIGGALGAALSRRGEEATELVVSVPVSARSGSVDGHLGNETGVRPIRIPTRGDALDRLVTVAQRSAAVAARTEGGRATSATPLLAAFRGLARVRMLGWLIEHQRLVHTFVTNVRGPATPLSLLGHVVREIVPIAVSPGNVGVTFDVLSYAGQLTVTVVADPEIVPDHGQVATEVQSELLTLIAGRR